MVHIGGGNMGAFSNIDVGLSEMKHGRGRELPRVGSFGVSLNDPNNPPVFLELLAIIGNTGLFWPDNGSGDILQFPLSDFWALT